VVFGRLTPNVTKGAASSRAAEPAEGKLFLDFMASEEAAEVLAKLVGATGCRPRSST
jgi:iron(III) transport system substrate-binding protein